MTTQPYVLESMIHEGGGAALYRGARADGATAFIRTPTREHATARDAARLRHECAILTELDHPATLLPPWGVAGLAGPALAIDGLRGVTLAELLKTRALDLHTTLRIASAAAAALAVVHSHRLIHKDVSPHNLIVDRAAMHVTLIGFGVATRLSHEPQRAHGPDALEGTLAYMAPEQTGRMNRSLDHRADLYALGVVIYEMLTGTLPFTVTDPVELIHSHIARTPPAPRVITPSVPDVVSAIVMKLLAKAAEDRYQRAEGLKADLNECVARLDAAGAIATFPLAWHDAPTRLTIPQKLYGREAECASLAEAFERADRGAAELVLVTGPSGIGKSALVHEIHKSIAKRRGGFFIAGKFDQLNRTTPYAPIIHAFNELIHSLLAEYGGELAEWRRELSHALGQGARVLTDVIPELTRIIGPQPPVPEISPAEAENRWNLAFEALVSVFATSRHPLILFLDDLQWADPASLKLVQRLLLDAGRAHLLILGAYRDNEVDAGHPLTIALEHLRRAGKITSTLAIRPLDLPSVTRLVADALGSDERHAVPLAQFVFHKTEGNPFFIGQLLLALEEDGAITFDAHAGTFTWDSALRSKSAVPDDVVTFMASKIQRLSGEAQRLLKLGACIGYQFDLRTSSIISGRSLTETAEDIWAALRSSLIEPVDPEYKFLQPGEDGSDPARLADLNVSYRFVHDRVQQAAYSLIEDQRKQESHLQIGRRLLASAGDELRDDLLFEIVGHLNLGAALVTDPVELTELARMNLLAGQRAKAAAAYEAAASFLRAGIAVKERAPAASGDALAFDLFVERAECEYLTGAFDEAEALFEQILSRAPGKLEKAHVYNLRLILYSTQGRSAEAVRVGELALALFGVDLPQTEDLRKEALLREREAVEARLAERPIESLVDAKRLEDPNIHAAQKLLAKLGSPAYLVSASLYALIAVKLVRLSLEHGNGPISAIGYMSYALYLAGTHGKYDEAAALGRLALELNERFENADLRCRLNQMFGLFIHFKQPIRSALTYFNRAYHAGIASGDFIYLANSCQNIGITRFLMGDDLADTLAETEGYLALTRRLKAAPSAAAQMVTRQAVANLMGRTRGPATLSDESFDEAELAALVKQSGFSTAACWYATAKLQIAYLYGSIDEALALLVAAEEQRKGGVGMYFATELPFYTCLVLLSPALAPDPTEEGRARREATLEQSLGKLAELATRCPENHLHKHTLVLAEQARVEGRELPAMHLYEEAMEQARAGLFTQHEALASELCARFHLAQGRPRSARAHMTDAYDAYVRWGATAKAADLLRRYPSLVALRAEVETPLRGPESVGSLGAATIDVSMVLRAAEAVAGELDLEKVVERLMNLVIKNAGAQKGVLLLHRGDELVVEATITTDPDMVQVGPPTPLEQTADLPRSILRHVERTRESVIVGDASREARFADDPYIEEHRPRSLLCLAMLRQGRFMGALYLENDVIHDAFPANRVELLRFLSSLAAIAVENALLYADVHRATDQLRRSNDLLEGEIEQRTEQLRISNAQLAVELAHREQADSARASLQEAIIEAQKARLAELSTPFIPITHRIMVMPLIGTMDMQRAEQVLEAALSGAQSNRARVVIIDITGVSRVDASVASTLLRTSGALRLLGVEAVITGVRPEVAQSLVDLGESLTGLAVRGTLQSGIAYALGRTGEGQQFYASAAPGHPALAALPRNPEARGLRRDD